jgi:RNA polymerase sigma-70 factor (ECF subfamily)
MTTPQPDTEELLRQAEHGDLGAREGLLTRHRVRLRKMVAWRLDRRLAARVDPSDVVQEVLAEASRKIDRYLRERPLPCGGRHARWGWRSSSLFHLAR